MLVGKRDIVSIKFILGKSPSMLTVLMRTLFSVRILLSLLSIVLGRHSLVNTGLIKGFILSF